jgi:hypothetical protein
LLMEEMDYNLHKVGTSSNYVECVLDETFKVRAGDLGLKYHMQVTRIPSEWVDASAYFPFPPPTAGAEPSAH